MADKKGFTLIELIVAVTIIGILVVIFIPNLMVYVNQTKAQSAKNNLLAIAAAQTKFYEDYGYFCSDQAPKPACGTSMANLIANLAVKPSMNDPFTYSCNGAPYTCTATFGAVTLTTTGSGVTCTAGGTSCPF